MAHNVSRRGWPYVFSFIATAILFIVLGKAAGWPGNTWRTFWITYVIGAVLWFTGMQIWDRFHRNRNVELPSRTIFQCEHCKIPTVAHRRQYGYLALLLCDECSDKIVRNY